MYRCKSFTIVVVYCFLQGAFASEWSYSGTHGHGPNHWSEIEGSQCGGSRQSPINIDTSQVQPFNFGEFKLEGYYLGETNAGRPLEMMDNGHTLTIILEGDYKLSGGGLPSEFRAVQFHFHWGSSDIQGSEHTVNGHRYAAEMHVVHYNSNKFASFSEAAASTDKDGVAVLGVFLEISPQQNSAFQEIFDLAHLVEYAGQNVSLANHGFSLSALLPKDKTHFYRYHGSLTTPMCNQIVVWTLFDSTVKISEDQIEVLRHLHRDVRGNPSAYIVDNFRQTQPLNGRIVHYNRHAKIPHHYHYHGHL